MKLTAEQIGYVSNYIQSFDIKWYELQVELTDHFVSIMEEIWNEDPELTFHQVKYRAEQRFGRNYFEEVVQERKKILQKGFNKKRTNAVIEYLKFPKVFISIFMIVMIYTTAFFSDNKLQFTKTTIVVFLLILMLYNLIYWLIFRKINGKRFLYVEMIFSLNGSSVFGIYGFMMLLKNTPSNTFHLFVFSCLLTFLILLTFTGIKLTKESIKEIKKQYQLT